MKIFLNDYAKETLEKAESLFFNGNGFLGVRGNLEEDYYDHFSTNRETYINGFYETKAIHYPEKMHGFTPIGESMVSVIDGQTTLITIGGERFTIESGKISHSKRYIDLEKGITVRELQWESPKGKITKITISRLASFSFKNLFSMQFEFEKINHDLPIEIETHLNFNPIRTVDKNDPRISHDTHQLVINHIDLPHNFCTFSTEKSKLTGELRWKIEGESVSGKIEKERIILSTTLQGTTYTKTLSYTARGYRHEGLDLSFSELAQEQENYLTEFWQDAKVEIVSDDGLEESVNYSTFALLQSAGIDGQSSVAAKGLSGSGYEGHYFWDTEMYIFPVFLHLQPTIAKKILEFRYHLLEKAKENRSLFGYQTGALYPWRTISGSESSAFFEAGSAQHHINADIAYAFISYYQYTRDLKFMFEQGFEVLLETARVFKEIGYLKKGVFHIDKVTGPDEYTVLVNDNYYTNKIVAHQFKWIGRFADLFAEEDAERWQKLCGQLGLTDDELEAYRCYGESMALPFNEELEIIAQDRDFLNKEFWPLSKEETHYPLLLNYHPLMIYRYQISKQADAVLALMLFEKEFEKTTIEKSIAYYDRVTTHDSSLSYSAFSIVYSRLGNLKKAYEYFLENARIDLDNTHNNTKDGIHTASMGGTFMTIVYGFCHLTIEEDQLKVTPNLPEKIKEIHFSTYFKGEKYQVSVTHTSATIEKVGE